MNALARPNTRLISALATLLVIAAPIVLAVTTLAPLESSPRGGRSVIVEETPPADGTSVDNGDQGNDQQRGGRRNRRNRDRAQDESDAVETGLSTPEP